MQRAITLAVAITMLAGASPAAADLARTITVQGVVLTSGGTAADGLFPMTFGLFAAATGGTALWTSVEAQVDVDAGLFDAELGPLPGGLLEAADALWLETRVGTEVLERRPLRAVPYALVSQHARTASALQCSGCVASGAVDFPWAASASKGGAASDLACSGCVSAQDLASGAVSTIHIQDGVVTGAKIGVNYALSASKGGPASDLLCVGCVSGAEIVASPELVGDVSVTGALTACTSGAPGCGVALGGSALRDHGDGWLTVQVPSGVRVRNQANGAWLPLDSGGGTANGTMIVTGNVGVGTATTAARVHVVGTAAGAVSALTLTNAADLTGARTRLAFSSMASSAPTVEIDAVKVAQGSAATALTVRTHTGSAWNDNQLLLASDGRVGVGVAAPVARLDVAGGVRVAGHEVTCAAAIAGTIRWNGTNFQGCNGQKWLNLDASGSDLGTSPSTPALSCLAIKQGDPTVADGVYWIDPNGGSTGDAFQIWCDMTSDGGGWTLVSKSNGSNNNHVGAAANNVADLQDTSVTKAGYIGDAARFALGRCYRVTSPADNLTKYAIVNNQLSFNEWWGNPNAGVLWRDTYSTTAADYTTTAGDDVGSPGYTVAIAYGGRNWARPNGQVGSGLFGGYGRTGLMYVKDCLGVSGLGASAGNPGASCLAILNAGSSVGDGAYWIDPNGGSTSDSLLVHCDMTSDGGGWTLVAKSNGADNLHVGTGFNGLPTSLANLSLNTSVYIGDAARLALGKCYRVTDASGGVTRYAYVTNSLSFSVWWGNPNPGVGWSDSYSTSAAAYGTPAADDAGSPGYSVALAYAGRNWARPNGYVGSGLFPSGGVYGRQGYILVKACIP